MSKVNVTGFFRNEDFSDFSDEEVTASFREALSKARDMLGQNHQLYIGDVWKNSSDNSTFVSINPSNPSEVIGTFSQGTKKDAEEAVMSANRAFQSWSKTDPVDRANLLFKVADLMRERRHLFSAMMTLEVGKTWPEADGDTCEAIDFLDFYAREMLRYASRNDEVTPSPLGDNNRIVYLPIGVGAIIPPWNFPVAILAGMTGAAIVTGNTVVLKPSSDSPMVGKMVTELFIEAGLPHGVLNFLPASGPVSGDYLVTHPTIRFVSFTGSMAVGKEINAKASHVGNGQIWLKRVIAEMGGKNASLIDKDANLDLAAESIVLSAFGFQGQKCSACSRALIHKEVYDLLIPKIVSLASKIEVGNPENQSINMGPVINQNSLDKCNKYLEIGKNEAELLLGGNNLEIDGGWFLEPTIFGNVSSGSRLEQDEIFGPILSLVKIDSYAHGVSVFNNTIYGLTGGYIGERHLNSAITDLHVGNLYLNRKITGALVDVEPFGGYHMSGTCSKAGGRDYLGLFLQMKTISERDIPN